MTNTFKLVRDNLDSDIWRFVTRRKEDPIVWANICFDFLTDAGTGKLLEQVQDSDCNEIECVILSKAHYDDLIDCYPDDEVFYGL